MHKRNSLQTKLRTYSRKKLKTDSGLKQNYKRPESLLQTQSFSRSFQMSAFYLEIPWRTQLLAPLNSTIHL